MLFQHMSNDNENKYGVDIAVRRADDLDRKALTWVQQEVQKDTVPNVFDLGCGAGGLSVRLANVGARVTGIDITDYQEDFDILQKQNNLTNARLRFYQADIRNISTIIYDSGVIDGCVIQRVLHYLTYKDAVRVLRELKSIGIKKIFVSVTGIESDIGRSYTDTDRPIEHRFGTLPPKDMEMFNINQPVCLYTPEEFMMLLQDSGWEIEECWISAFGNIKAVCSQF